MIRAIKATNPDLVFVGGYPPTARASSAPMFGGGMVGLQLAALKQQFGSSLNGLVNYELFVREPTVKFPGIDQFIAEYRKRPAGRRRRSARLLYSTLHLRRAAGARAGDQWRRQHG